MEPPPKGSLGSICFFQRYKIRVPTMALSSSRTEQSFVAEASPQNYQNQSPYSRSPSPGPLCSQGENNLSTRSYKKPPFIPAAYHKSTVASRNKLNPCAVRLKSQSPNGYRTHNDTSGDTNSIRKTSQRVKARRSRQFSPTISPTWGRSKSDILLLDGLSSSSSSMGSVDLSAPLSFTSQEHKAPVGILLQLKPKLSSELSSLPPPEPTKPMASPGPAAKKKAGLKSRNLDRSPAQGSRWARSCRPPASKQPTPPSFRKRLSPSPKTHETTQKSESVGVNRDSRGSSITSPNNALSSNSMQEVSSLRTQSISTISESRFETCGQNKGVPRVKPRPRVLSQVTSPERWNARACSERQHSVFSNSKSISSFNLSHASPQVIDYQSWLLGNIPVQGRPKSCTYGIRDLRQNTFGASYGLISTRGHSGGSGFAFGSSDGDSAPIAAVRRRSEKWRQDADSLNVIRGAFLGAAEFLHRRKRNRSRDRDKKIGVDKAVSTASMLTAESQNDDATNAISANELDEKQFGENTPKLNTGKAESGEGLRKETPNADPSPTEKSLAVDKQLRSIDTQTQIAGIRDSPPIRGEPTKNSPKKNTPKKTKKVRKILPRSKSKERKLLTRTSPERKKRKTRRKTSPSRKANSKSPVKEEKPQSVKKVTSPSISPRLKLTRARLSSPSIAESVKAYKKYSLKKGKPNITNQNEDVSKTKKDGEDDASGKQNNVQPEKNRVSPGAVISVTYEEDTSSSHPEGASSVGSKEPTPKMRLSSIQITNIIIPIQEFASATSETESEQCKPDADDKTFEVHDESSQLDLTTTQPSSHNAGHKKTVPVDNLSEKSTTRRKISNFRRRSKSPTKSPRGKSPNQKTQFFKHRPRSKATAPAVHKKTHPPVPKTAGRHSSPKRRDRSSSTKKSVLKDTARSPSRGRKQKLNTAQPAAGKTNSAKNTSSSPKPARENYLKIRIQPARLILTKKKIQAWQKQNKMATVSPPSESKTMSTSGLADAQSSSSPEAASECGVRQVSPSLSQPGCSVANEAGKTQTDVDAALADDSSLRPERGKISKPHQSSFDANEYTEVLETDLDVATQEYRSRRNPSRCGNSREQKLSPVLLARTSRNFSPAGHLSRKTPMFARYSRMGLGVGGHSTGSSAEPAQKKYVTFRKNWKDKPTEPGASPTPVSQRPVTSSSYGIQSSLQKYAKQNRLIPKDGRKAPIYHPPWARPRNSGAKHVTHCSNSSNVGSSTYSIPPRNLAWDSIFDRLDSVDVEGKEDNGASRLKYGLLFVVIFIQCLIQYFITND